MPTDDGSWPIKELTDAQVMRAMAHPVRMKLVELLLVDGPLTATECGARLDETPANCSFHLRTLAKHGFVEEAEGGTGRQRPWRAVPQGTNFPSGPSAPPHLRAAADLLTRTFAERNVSRLYAYLDRMDDYGKEWSDAAMLSDLASYLTPEELTQLREQLIYLLRPYVPRLADPASRPEGARLVTFFLAGFPTEPAAGEGPDDA
ncbi:MAG: helix-turn-helix domain-containing protein [Streptosporangiales bacterium]|nr:helix-turn-helix domain-containing protein [Streptosporangiales bacterium]